MGSPTTLRPSLRLNMPKKQLRQVVLALLPVVAVALLAGCGGGKSEEDVEALLDRAFKQSIKSADVKIDAELKVDGLQGFDRPVRLEAQGPYIGGDKQLPTVDIDLKIGAADAGQTVTSGFLSTGDRAFVKFGGEFYEQPKEDVARANAEIAKGSSSDQGSLRELGLNPRTWVIDAKGEDDETIAGVETEHVSGKLDVRRLFADLNNVVQRSAGAVGGAPAGTPKPLTDAALDELADVVENPTFDIYVGKEDDVIRRVSGNLTIKVAEKDRARVNGISGGSLRFSVELAKVNGDQAVEAPEKSRPIADLTSQLRGAGTLGALGGGGADSQDPATTAPGTVPENSGGGVETFKEYTECLDKTRPDDSEARARCNELLR
jgi:hypothetical protein